MWKNVGESNFLWQRAKLAKTNDMYHEDNNNYDTIIKKLKKKFWYLNI